MRRMRAHLPLSTLRRPTAAAAFRVAMATVLAVAVASARPLPAQEVTRLASLVADGRVFLYPSRIPAEGEGWIVRRDGRPLSAAPLTGARGSAEFAASVGSEMALLQSITKTDNAFETYRRLRVSPTAGGIAQVLSPAAAAALGALFVDSTATAGATYEYEAVRVRLNRPDSVLQRATALVRVVPSPLPLPPVPSATVTDGAVTITWRALRTAPISDDPTIAYLVERADSTGEFLRLGPFPVMRILDGPSGTRDESALGGRFYRYRVRSIDPLGRLSAPSAVVSARAPTDRGPAPPEDLGAQADGGRIRVVWTLSTQPEVRGYHVERSVGGDSAFRRLTRTPVPIDDPEYVDSLVRGRVIYAYRVRAIDADGRLGPPSNPTTMRAIDATAPAAVTDLRAMPLPGPRVRLTWRLPPDRDLREFALDRAEPRDTHFVRIATIRPNITAHIDTGYDAERLEPGREYTWRLMAIDSSGNEGPFARVSLALVDDEAPAPARSVTVRNHLGRWVEVTWTGSPSIDVVRYEVRRIRGAAAPAAGSGASVLVATVAQGAEFAVRDTTAVRGELTQWVVVPIDSVGNRGTAMADTLTFRDLDRPAAPRRVTAVRDSGVVRVRWERVPSTDLRGYVVYRAERTDGPRTRLAAVAATVQEFVDRSGPARARYFVRAVDAGGNESDESPVAVLVERRP